MIWKDCFGRPLVDGEDAVVGIIGDDGNVELHSAVILELYDEDVFLSYNGWDENGEEYTVDKLYTEKDYPDGIIKSLFKILN